MTNSVPGEKLRRSSTDKMIAGVAGGWAELLGVDASIIRIVLAAATLLGFGAPILIYAICWAVMPQE
ncbi:PspC domain-containing protein [Amycolatopsis granulosa]|uniref:PspC domain-containing protein n=1 Tax=Amycolatopsis granulosa TaxID=185684 RepID=UPI001422C506|nr:PspC domain-containing protein [Amycolatopsis granulosa]NIH86906.1 phage shock protein PspC (stress-responsive transcriptional regulator) [Amycolatopsis granulosa]